MTKLIINADDFGYCEGVNEGIVSAHVNGVVTSATIMSSMPGFEHANEILLKNSDLGCGIHLNISCGKPLLKSHKTIVNEDGYFYKRLTTEKLKTMNKLEIHEEFCAQIEKTIKSGIDLSHIDSHHHIHGNIELRDVINDISARYNLHVRDMFEYESEIKYKIKCVDWFYGENINLKYLKENINNLKQYDVVDLMCHPAFLDDFLMNSTSYSHNRKVEHDLLVSDEVKELLLSNNIQLINYLDLKK